MDNFNWTEFSKRIFININLKSVYDFWTKSEELEKWFLSNASFLTMDSERILPSENVKSGSSYNWTWFAQNYAEDGTVNDANGIDYIEFTFAGKCIVQVQLFQKGDQTIVELTQSKIPIDNNSKENIRLGCAFGWTFYLLNLKSVLEGGLDLRNKDTSLVGVVNN